MKKVKDDEKGAIDLASIMTGLIVLGIIGGIIAATVFVIIPWAQDQMAKKQVSEIKVAQTTYAAGNADPNNKAYGALLQAAEKQPVKYATLGELVDKGLLSIELDDGANGVITTARQGFVCANTTNSQGYEIAVRSATGNVFYTTDEVKNINKAAPGENYCLKDPLSEEEEEKEAQLPTFKFTIDTSLCPNPSMRFNSVRADSELIDPEGNVRTLAEGWNNLNRSGTWTVRGNFGGLGATDANADRHGCLTSVDEWESPSQATGHQKYQQATTKYNQDKVAYDTALDEYMKAFAEADSHPRMADLIERYMNGEVSDEGLYEEYERILAELLPPMPEMPTPPKEPTGYQSNLQANYAFAGAVNLESIVTPPFTVNTPSRMFYQANKLQNIIGDWKLVGDASYMFYDASAFNGNINNWDVSDVTNMSSMFGRATSFNQNISSWNTGNVTNMSGMFFGTAVFNQPLNGWNTSNVTNMSSMFGNTQAFNSEISGWNTANVTNMSNMFASSRFNQNIGTWDTGNLTTATAMFQNNRVFNQPIGGWNTQNVTATDSMFSLATAFNQNIGGWNTSKVANMSNMFFGASVFNQNINAWNVSNVTNMSSMFETSGTTNAFNQPLNNWNVSKVANMSNMFRWSAFNQNINSWNVRNVTNMDSMFYGTTAFNQTLNSWNTSNVTNMSYMFYQAVAFNQNISSWNVSKVTASTDFKTHSVLTNANTPAKFR